MPSDFEEILASPSFGILRICVVAIGFFAFYGFYWISIKISSPESAYFLSKKDSIGSNLKINLFVKE